MQRGSREPLPCTRAAGPQAAAFLGGLRLADSESDPMRGTFRVGQPESHTRWRPTGSQSAGRITAGTAS